MGRPRTGRGRGVAWRTGDGDGRGQRTVEEAEEAEDKKDPRSRHISLKWALTGANISASPIGNNSANAVT